MRNQKNGAECGADNSRIPLQPFALDVKGL
jgi:hypothetical protein